MIKENLAKLSDFINEVENQKPIDFLYKQMKKLEENIGSDSLGSKLDTNNFSIELNSFLDFYKKKGVPDEELIFEIYQRLLLLTKNNAIHSYAYSLGLKPSLYKDEMRLLFKGKTK
ncbi:hypothetical protein B6U98_01450 [Thermoplasmatales archaeon ex4572_165]|nr:MAG: hypothetical protein B6U98_01450 [Thermoplasmatales archaeon ex4572_165]